MRFLLTPAIVLFLFGISQLESQFLGIDFEKKDEHLVTIKAEKRGFPFVNFENGKEFFSNNSIANGSQAKVLASADFDSDGIADLVTVDSTGSLKLYRGNAEYRGADNKLSKQENRIAPFYPEAKSFSLNISPDYLETGDFNADGKKDILAVAKNDNNFKFLSGDGKGSFTEPLSIPLDGQIASLAIGEIGKQDGQTDVAAVVTNSKGSFLFVFEHPESAFKHKPEIFKLDSPAVSVAIGNLDDDFYADIAVAGGNELAIIHGRGQAYPWDLDKKFGIERPKAVVAKRQMPFTIAGLEIGDFNDARGDDLAILANSGSVSILEPARDGKVSTPSLNTEARRQIKGASFAPTAAGANKYALLADSQIVNEQAAKEHGLTLVDSQLSQKEKQEFLTKKAEEEAKKLEKLSKEESAKQSAEAKAKAEENRQRAKEAFIKTISGRPSTLANWKLVNLISDARLKNAANSPISQKLIKARISDSGKDDLVLLDSISKQIQIVAETKTEEQPPKTELISLDAESGPVSILKMRLNADSLDDLVVLREGSPQPSFLLTAPAATFTVNTTSDGTSDCMTAGQPCTLRQAIQLANSSPGADTIAFSIFGCGPHKIQPLSELPPITQAVTIFGGSQPCSSPSSPRIEINGEQLGMADGLKIRAGNCFISGLVITGFRAGIDEDTGSVIGGNGITLETTVGSARSSNNFVANNFIGVAPDGNTDRGNDGMGIHIYDSDSNNIQGNTLSGNGAAGLAVTNGNNNFIVVNKMGTNAAGTAKLPNDGLGLLLSGKNNQIGGDGTNQGNTISGNGKMRPPDSRDFTLCTGKGIGIYALVSLDTGEQLTGGNTLKGNRIGTDPSGTQPLGNCITGVEVAPITVTTIGSITQNGRNVISDNGYDAIHCDTRFDPPGYEGGYCLISGNNVGTDVTGTAALGNDWRNVYGGLEVSGISTIFVFNNNSLSIIGQPGGTTRGGDCTGFCNLVSGNGEGADGAIGRIGSGAVGIFNNYIGTNKSGNAALSNNSSGIYVEGNDTSIGSYNTQENLNFGNLISGNKFAGILLFPQQLSFASTFNIEANLIGTNITGASAIPNGTDNHHFGTLGIYGFFNKTVNIGGVNPFSRNIISGNNTSGIWVAGVGGQTNIINNYIGLSKFNQPLGNAEHGIRIVREGTIVGGTLAGAGNVISNNTLAGVAVESSSGSGGSSTALNNTIRGNSIRDNGGLGIDLTLSTPVNANPDGVTPNDCDDSDEGPNRRQNFPILFAPTFNQDGTVTVSGTLRSLPLNKYKIDFYSNTAADPTEYGEGEAYLGEKEVTANGNGVVYFEFTSATPVANTRKITATATDPEGNTSEFSCYAGGCETSGFQNAAEAEKLYEVQELGCLVPIVVNITTDEPDADGDQPEEVRDERCDVFTDPEHPGDQCSLRAAIQEANARSGFDLINFNIPGGGIKTISPMTALPEITDRVLINGTTQPGDSDSPLIELNGINTPEETNGLDFKNGSGGTSGVYGSGSTVMGLSIYNWRNGKKINFDKSDSSQVLRCYLGVRANGTFLTDSQFSDGVSLNNSSYVRVGFSDSDGNLISGNYRGITLSNCQNCRIESNKIGTDKTGMTAIPNDFYGIELKGEANTGTRIFKNVISGNKIAGIHIEKGGTGDTTLNNNIFENLIGTTSDGMNKIPGQGFGIVMSDSGNNRISSNTISGNSEIGIFISRFNDQSPFADLNQIDSNKIGVSADGLNALPNKTGIIISNASKNKIGSFGANIISGNTEKGIIIETPSVNPTAQSNENEIVNNLIGLNANNQDLGNGKEGIFLNGSVSQTLIKGNTISGNGLSGVESSSKAENNIIRENKIGTFAPNKIGITITSSSRNKIHDNEIVGNEDFNILLGNSVPLFSEEEPTAANRAVLLDQVTNAEENEIFSNIIKNSKVGLAITEGAKNNRIGDYLSSGKGNTIIGNTNGGGYGIFLGTTAPNAVEGLLPSGNTIHGNNIGFELRNTQTTIAPNKVGLVINQARDNFIGEEGRSNWITSSLREGIILSGNQTRKNLIAYNKIGASLDLTLPNSTFGNGSHGIAAVGTGENSIKFNIIGNNGGNGIYASTLILQYGDNYSLIISGNQIGVTGNSKTGNANAGIRFNSVPNGLIGVQGEAKNIIAGNGGDGILIEGEESKYNIIANSIIGTIVNGSADFGNAGNGIYIKGGRENLIGGFLSVGNLISGNNGNGIFLENAHYNEIRGNQIGIFPSENGNIKLGNNQNGIKLLNSHTTDIGGAGFPDLRNYIGANTRSGIVLQGEQAQHNRIKGNFIGLDNFFTNFGNGLHGVFITEKGQKNIIGGKEIEAGNIIAYNGSQLEGGAGVYIDPMAGSGNNTDPNLIFGNFGLGIDLGATGHTPNDPADADTGPNNLQNYPEIVSRQIVNNELIIGFKVDSAPGNSNYGADGIYIEFFKADASGEGEKFLGFSYYIASDYNNGAPKIKQVNLGSITTLGITANDKITATATDSDGNTSEFMPAVGSIYSISGKVSYRNQVSGELPKSVASVLLTATVGSAAPVSTNSNGAYLFDNLENGSYTITPSKTGDINGISPFDATLILRHVAAYGTGPNALSPIQKIAADASGDGNISPFDATLILRFVAANGPNANTGQVGVWKFDPPSREYAPLAGTIDNQNYEAILVGEVNGNWTPSSFLANETATKDQKVKTSDQAINVSLSETNTVINGRTVIVPVIISNETRKAISGLSFDITYDPAVLQPDIEQPIQTTDKSDGFMLVADTTASGRIGIAGSTAGSLIAPDGTFLMLRFKVIGESIYASNAAKLMFSQQLNFIDESGNSIATAKRAFQPN
ncbi:MAG TPA: CSLREA domain-containing protein [Pyrinomonadaceae bacterium]|jgi:CSLREA domain-containing protein